MSDESKPNEGRRYERELPVHVPDHERDAKAVEASNKRVEARTLRDKLKKDTQPIKDKIATLEAEAEALEAIVSAASKFAMVECEEVVEFAKGLVFVRRMDTGDTVEEREITDLERQGVLYDEGKKKIEAAEKNAKKPAKKARIKKSELD